MGRTPSFHIMIIGAAFTLGCIGLVHIQQQQHACGRYLLLTQMAKAFKLYSNESKGERYPPKAASSNWFIPDLHMLRPYLAQVGDADELSRQLLDRTCEKPLCYMGHTLFHEGSGLMMLRKYQTDDPHEVRLSDHGKTTAREQMSIYLLREGIERFYIYDIGNPAASAEIQSKLPVMWELPLPGQSTQGLVLYLDGHVEAVEYPGRFPMSPRFVREVRAMMGLEDTGIPIDEAMEAVASSPVGEEAEAILEATSWWALPFNQWRIAHCDKSPDMRLGNCMAYKITLSGLHSAYYGADRESKFDVYLAPLDCHPAEVSPSLDDTIAFIGQSQSFQWYSNAPLLLQEELRTNFALVGGVDRYSLFAKECDLPFLSIGLTATNRPYLGHPVTNDHPSLFHDCKVEFLARRDSEGAPIPEELKQAECVLLKYLIPDYGGFRYPADMAEQAKQVIATSPDQEAATMIALELALTYWPRNAKSTIPYKELNQNGMELLMQIEHEVSLPILREVQAKINFPEQVKLLDEAISQVTHDQIH